MNNVMNKAKPLNVAMTLLNLSSTFRKFFYSDDEKVVFDYIDDEGNPKHVEMPTFHNTLKTIKTEAVSYDELNNVVEEFSKRLASGDIRNKIIADIQAEISKAKVDFMTEMRAASTAASKADLAQVAKDLHDTKSMLSDKIDSVFDYSNESVKRGFDTFNAKIKNLDNEISSTRDLVGKGMQTFSKGMEAKEKAIDAAINGLKNDMQNKMDEVLSGAGKDKIIADVKKAIDVESVIKSIMVDVNKKLEAAQKEFVSNVGANYLRKDHVGSTDIDMNRGGKLLLKKTPDTYKSGFVGHEGEITYDSKTKEIVIHDGHTRGGFRIRNNVRKVDYRIGMSAHGYGNGPSTGSAETLDLATEAIKIVATNRTTRYYGGQGLSYKLGKTYAFGGHRDNNTIWDHATYSTTEASFGYHDAYVNATTSNEFDKSYVGTRNGNDHISLFNHITNTTQRAKFGYTMGNCTGGFSNSRDIGYLDTSGNNFTKFAFATDTPVRVNYANFSMSAHDQATTQDLDTGIMQYGGNGNSRIAMYEVNTDTNWYVVNAIDHTGEGSMAGTNINGYILGGYSSGQGGNHSQNAYINIVSFSIYV